MKTIILASITAALTAGSAIAATGHADDISRVPAEQTVGAESSVNLMNFLPQLDETLLPGDEISVYSFDAEAEDQNKGYTLR